MSPFQQHTSTAHDNAEHNIFCNVTKVLSLWLRNTLCCVVFYCMLRVSQRRTEDECFHQNKAKSWHHAKRREEESDRTSPSHHRVVAIIKLACEIEYVML